MTNLKTFQQPSTFTYLGRHAVSLAELVRRLPECPVNVLEIGSGFLEPFYIADLIRARWPNEGVGIDAVDVDVNVINTLTKLLNGEKISFVDAATIACNVESDGRLRPNSDFLKPEGLALGIRDLEASGLPKKKYLNLDEQCFVYTGPNYGIITPRQNEILVLLTSSRRRYDFIYAGTVIMNMKKTYNHEDIARLYVTIQQSLSTQGVFAMGTTPADLYGSSSSVKEILDAGFEEITVVVENLVHA
ncbi:MAG: hypothetical protein WC254_03380, partial [Candidatus Woesearchaeota archaeon]